MGRRVSKLPAQCVAMTQKWFCDSGTDFRALGDCVAFLRHSGFASDRFTSKSPSDWDRGKSCHVLWMRKAIARPSAGRASSTLARPSTKRCCSSGEKAARGPRLPTDRGSWRHAAELLRPFRRQGAIVPRGPRPLRRPNGVGADEQRRTPSRSTGHSPSPRVCLLTMATQSAQLLRQ